MLTTKTTTVVQGCYVSTEASSACPLRFVPETAWQIERNLGPMAEARFLRLITAGELIVVDLVLGDYARCADLIETYADMSLGFCRRERLSPSRRTLPLRRSPRSTAATSPSSAPITTSGPSSSSLIGHVTTILLLARRGRWARKSVNRLPSRNPYFHPYNRR